MYRNYATIFPPILNTCLCLAMPNHFAGLSRNKLDQARWAMTKNSEDGRIWGEIGIWKSSPWSYLLIFNLKTQYHESQCVVVVLESLFLPKSSQNFIGHNFPSSVLLTVVFLQNSQVNLQYYRVISYWDGFWPDQTSWLIFCCQFFGRKNVAKCLPQ